MKRVVEIIVVSPDQYKDLARKLSHEISKVPGFNGAFWSIKQFEDNEFQLGGNRYAIFLGNSNENKITKDFLEVIQNLKNQAGACYGFDGTKAVIFGEGRLDQQDVFIEVIKNSKALITSAGVATSVGAGIAATSIVFLPVALLSSSPVILLKIFQLKREKELRVEQTKAALTLFLAEHFDNWLGIDK